MNTAQKFYDFCVKHDACKVGLQAIRGLTAAKWWDATNRGDWMLWLRGQEVWSFTTEQQQDFEAKVAPLWADYEATRASLDAWTRPQAHL